MGEFILQYADAYHGVRYLHDVITRWNGAERVSVATVYTDAVSDAAHFRSPSDAVLFACAVRAEYGIHEAKNWTVEIDESVE